MNVAVYFCSIHEDILGHYMEQEHDTKIFKHKLMFTYVYMLLGF